MMIEFVWHSKVYDDRILLLHNLTCIRLHDQQITAYCWYIVINWEFITWQKYVMIDCAIEW